jgi:uncharacterized protein YuzE
MRKFTYDPKTDTAYLSLSSVDAEDTIIRRCALDLDDKGNIIGIEIFNASDAFVIINGIP